MEELQSWWEVPAVAHFCNVFRAAFHLFYFDVEELEACLLEQNLDDFVSVEQLIIKLLPRCCGVKDVTDNWEIHLSKLLRDKWPKEGRENPLKDGVRFYSLPVRTKVDILYSLCLYRLDAEDVFYVTRNIPSDDLRADCIGFDSAENYYWYFGGLRLYKEVQSKKEAPKSDKNSRSGKSKKCTLPSSSSSWSVACFSMEDWKDLLKSLKKQRTVANKKLADNIEEKYIPILTAITAKKEREMKKRLMELAPRRCSSRIDQVRKQKELAERKAAELAEEKRLRKAAEDEKRRAVEEKERKRREVHERAKRLEERRNALQARATRARFRDLRKIECEDSDAESLSLDENSNLKEDHDFSSKYFSNKVAEKYLSETSDECDTDEEFQNGEESKSESEESETDSDVGPQTDEESSNKSFFLKGTMSTTADKKSRNSHCDKDVSQRLCMDMSMPESSSSSEEFVPMFHHKKVKLAKSKDYQNVVTSPSLTWSCIKPATVPCEKIVVCKDKEQESSGAKQKISNSAPVLKRQLLRQSFTLRKKSKAEERNKALAVTEHDENDDNSESGSSYSVEIKECRDRVASTKDICTDESDVFFRKLTCEADRKDRRPLLSNNNSQYCDNFSDFKNTNLHTSVQLMSPQQSSSHQRSPFSRRNITVLNSRSNSDFVNLEHQDGTPPSPSWSLKTASVPCEKVVGYSDRANLPNCEKKIRFYTKPNARVSISRIDLVNGSPKKVQKINSRVHR